MIRYITKPNTNEEIFDTLNPIVSKWFKEKFGSFSEPQKYALLNIHNRKNTFVSAATGSGKCITPDSTILLNIDGKTRLLTGYELVELSKKGKFIAKVDKSGRLYKVPDLQSYSLENNQIKKKKALIYFENYKGKIYHLKTEYGREIKLSPDHPLLVEKNGEEEWTPVKNIKEKEKIAVPIKIDLPEKEIFLNYRKAIKNLRKKAEIVLTYKDYLRLKRKTNNFINFERLNSKELYKIKTLLKTTFKKIGVKLGLGSIATVFSLFNKGHIYSKCLEKEFFELLKKECKKINFERNRIVVKNKGNQTISFKYPKKVNIELSRWVAFILAEGLIGDYEKGTHLTISQKSRIKLLNEVLRNTKKIFDLEFKQKNYKDYAIYSTLFCYFLNDLLEIKRGRGRYIPLPNWLLNAKKEIKSNFLNVFFSLEATIQKNGKEISIVQSNQNKIEIINYLLSSFGIFSSVSKKLKYAANTKNKTKRLYYSLDIRQIRNLKLFLNNIGIEHQKKEILKKYILRKGGGEYVLKHKFDYKKIGALSGLYKNYKTFQKDLKNIYTVVKRTGYITENALINLKKKLLKFKNRDLVINLIEYINSLLNKNICWLRIKEIKILDYNGKLVDLTVPDIHNFIGGYGGLYLHNTLTGFTSVLSELISFSEKNKLEDKVYCVYISPLKALSNDIEINLKQPFKEMEKIAGKEFGIRVNVRTGDTTTAERQKMLKKPPHILISTPESLALLLSSPKFKELLKDVKWCIIDELHALCDNKRGVHLSLSLERLQSECKDEITRIGLGATCEPLEEIAKFLVGNERTCKIAKIDSTKKMDLKVLSPTNDLMDTTHKELHESMYNLINNLVQDHKTTLIFTNTRAGTERVVHNLKEKFPDKYNDENIGAHHGSLSKSFRLNLENRMREGKLKAIVCLEGNSKILDSNGNWIKIKDIDERKVASLDKKLKLSNNKIITKITKENRENLIKITTSLGKEITCTKEHKFLTINENGELEWKEGQNLDKKDYIGTIRKYNYKTLTKNELDMLALDNYPNEGYLELKKEFLKNIKNKIIVKHKKIKLYWVNKLKNHISYSMFLQDLRGNFLFKVEIIKKIINDLKIKKEYLWDNIINFSSDKYRSKRLEINEDLIRLLGFMSAEGYISNRALYVSNKDKKLLKYYWDLIKKLSGRKPFKKLNSNGTTILSWESVFLSKFLKNIGFKIGRKSRINLIPEFIFSLESKFVFSYLSGYLDGDGFPETKKDGRTYSLGFSTASKEMANNLMQLLLREGIVSSIRSKYVDGTYQLLNNKKIIKKGWFYGIVIIGGDHLRNFIKNITPKRDNLINAKKTLLLDGYSNLDIIPNLGIKLRDIRKNIGISAYKLNKETSLDPTKYELNYRAISRKQLKRLLTLYNNKDFYLNNFTESDIFWEKIKSKIKVNKEKFVYNIEVANDHNYIANGFITKNCSTSLELGIDIGYIDLVICLGSPKSIARFCQRAGRSGHKLHDTIKGRILVLDRDDLVECSVMLKGALEANIDKIDIPKNCLDVLAQQIHGIAVTDRIKVEDLLKLVKKSYCYKDLEKSDFIEVINYLAGKFTTLEDRYVYAKIWYDEETGMIGKKGKLSRLIYMTNIGTIPDESFITIKIGEEVIGHVDEAFLERLKPNDVFVLGGQVYQFLYSRGMTAQVRASLNRPPTVPSWFSESLPLSFDLAMNISKVRGYMETLFKEEKSKEEILDFINKYLKIDGNSAEAFYEYFKEQFLFSEIPSDKKLLVEFFNDQNKKYVVFHSLYGRRVNDVLSRAVSYAIARIQHKDIELGVNDNGFFICCDKKDNIQVMRAFKLLKSQELRKVLDKAIDGSEVFKRRFRHCATRALMILRQYKGKKKMVGKQQMSSMLLISALRRIDENFCILKEARREVLEDLMDIKNATRVLKDIEDGRIKIKQITTSMPSPFALNFVLQGYLDVLKIEDKMEFLKKMHNMIKAKIGLGR